MAIELYQTPPSGPCRAVVMTAKHLGVELKINNLDLQKGETRTPEFLKMNPLHTVPTINDNGFVLYESRAIITYLCNKYGPDSSLYPKDPQKRALVDKLLYFDIGSLYKSLAAHFYPQMFMGKPSDPETAQQFKDQMNNLEMFLEKNKYVAGDELTLADISIFSEVTFIEVADYDFSPFPKVQAWMNLLKQEMPFQKEVNDEPLEMLRGFLKSKK